MTQPTSRYLNPYIGGLLLAGLLLISYLILGTGIGASGGLARLAATIEGLVASEHVRNSAYFGRYGASPLSYYLVYMLIGSVLGGFVSAFLSGRFKRGYEKGAKCHTKTRVMFALVGGILVGYASRMARGCTSGQALSGGALLLTGSLLFVVCLFISGYATARFFKRQWHD
ncbi:MAG: YeeE/YedE thiosulfate transporter family protein [Myxococcota bacterium]|nr:YeeE/YedE thiosulfate transporter family protein [Myxococcota bacterium]